MPPIAAVVAQLTAAPKPVICLDTCDILEIVQCVGWEGPQTARNVAIVAAARGFSALWTSILTGPKLSSRSWSPRNGARVSQAFAPKPRASWLRSMRSFRPARGRRPYRNCASRLHETLGHHTSSLTSPLSPRTAQPSRPARSRHRTQSPWPFIGSLPNEDPHTMGTSRIPSTSSITLNSPGNSACRDSPKSASS